MAERILLFLINKVVDYLLRKLAKEVEKRRSRYLREVSSAKEDKENLEELTNAKDKKRKLDAARDILTGL